MKPPRDLTRPQLSARLSTLSARLSDLSAELIAAGRGFDRPSEIRCMTDPLSARFNECMDDYRQASDEAARRGTLTPTPSRGD